MGYPLHGFFCCLSFILVYFFYPETMGIPLEEMDELFNDSGAADIEERAPLRATAAERAATEPPKLTDEDYNRSEGLYHKLFGKAPSRNGSSTDLANGGGGRPQSRTGSQE